MIFGGVEIAASLAALPPAASTPWQSPKAGSIKNERPRLGHQVRRGRSSMPERAGGRDPKCRRLRRHHQDCGK
jgi:hypothetical protein